MFFMTSEINDRLSPRRAQKAAFEGAAISTFGAEEKSAQRDADFSSPEQI
jgi:hypothetical protein